MHYTCTRSTDRSKRNVNSATEWYNTNFMKLYCILNSNYSLDFVQKSIVNSTSSQFPLHYWKWDTFCPMQHELFPTVYRGRTACCGPRSIVLNQGVDRKFNIWVLTLYHWAECELQQTIIYRMCNIWYHF